MNPEVLKERERIKEIVKEIILDEIEMDRKEFPKRLNHIEAQITFKIDNPNYKNKNIRITEGFEMLNSV